MELEKIQVRYILFLLFLLFFFKCYLLLLILLIIKGAYASILENAIEQDFDSFLDFDMHMLFFNDPEVENLYMDILLDEEAYLFYNCHFFFDFYGGSKILEVTDYF